MKKLYFAFVILLTFSFAAKAEDALPPVEYGTDPYKYDYGKIRGDDPFQPKQAVPEQPLAEAQPLEPAPMVLQQEAKTKEELIKQEQQKQAKQPDELQIALKAKYKFALLLPLTGKGSDIGKALKDAARLAINEKADANYAIIPIDVNGTGGVEAATQKAIGYGANVILGPVFSDTVAKAAPIARKNNIKIFSFSNNKAIAGNGVYILGMLPDQQVERMLLYSNGRGIKGYAAIVPDNAYGKQITDILHKYSSWAGGTVRDVGIYSQSTKFDVAARSIAKSFQKQDIKPNRNKDLLVIPEGGNKLNDITAALAVAGVGCNVLRCLGVSSWDDRDVISIKGLDGAWYAASPYEEVEQFLYRFQSANNYLPDEIATLAYDATNMAIELSGTGFDADQVQRRKGFRGIKGIYRFMPDGTSQRGYAIYEIKQGVAQVIDGAPNRF